MATEDKKHILGFVRGGKLHLIKSIQGNKGDKGNGIYSVEQIEKSLLDGGINKVLITDTDGNNTIMEIQNGSQGPEGPTGPLAVYDSNESYPPFEVANETGQSDTIGMTQKAITDAIEAMGNEDWKIATVKVNKGIRVLVGIPASPSGGASSNPDDYPMVWSKYTNNGTSVNVGNRYQINYVKVYAGERVRITYRGNELSSYPGTYGEIWTFTADDVPQDRTHWTAIENKPYIATEPKSYIECPHDTVTEGTAIYSFDTDCYFWIFTTRENTISVEKTSKVKDALSSIKDRLTEVENNTSVFKEIDTSEVTMLEKIIWQLPTDSFPVWHNNKDGYARSKLVQVESNSRIRIYSDVDASYAIMIDNSNSVGTGNYPHYAQGYTTPLTLLGGDTKTLEVPEDGKYIYFTCINVRNQDTGFTVSKLSSMPRAVEELRDTVKLMDTSTITPASTRVVAEAFGQPLTSLDIEVDGSGWEIPQTVQERNVAIKANQMLNIKWVPKNNILHQKGSGFFLKDTVVTGLPYSSVKEHNKFIGQDVSIYTFMTAVNNPYSLLYTERVRKAGANGVNVSAWWTASEKYHGVNCGAYYGVVCSALTGYATGQVVHEETGFNKWVSENRFRLIKINNQSADGLRIGDILWTKGHNRLVYKLKRNSETGQVTRVQMCEARGNCVRPYFPDEDYRNDGIRASDFNNLLFANAPRGKEKGIVYRNIELYKNLDFEKGPIFNEDGSLKTWDAEHNVYEGLTYNNNICTFAGDKVTFRAGEFVVLNYNLENIAAEDWGEVVDGSDPEEIDPYVGIEVYKHIEKSERTSGGSIKYYKVWVKIANYLFNNIEQASLPESQQGHALKIEGLEFGEYAARVITDEDYEEGFEPEPIEPVEEEEESSDPVNPESEGEETDEGEDPHDDEGDYDEGDEEIPDENETPEPYEGQELPGNAEDYTYWEMLDVHAEYRNSGKADVVTWETKNAHAIGMCVCSKNGGRFFFDYFDTSHIKTLTPTLEKGEYRANLVQLMNAQRPDYIYVSGQRRFIKVYFQGQYGRVTSEAITVSWEI